MATHTYIQHKRPGYDRRRIGDTDQVNLAHRHPLENQILSCSDLLLSVPSFVLHTFQCVFKWSDRVNAFGHRGQVNLPLIRPIR
jgi:hypothetical protein